MDILDSNILLHYVRRSPLAADIGALYALTTANPAPIISIVTEGELRALALQLVWGAQRRPAPGISIRLLPRHPIAVLAGRPGLR